MKRACLTGITGQTGSYLAEILLEKGYEVHGLVRRSSSFNTGRIDHIFDQLHLAYGDLSDYGSISNWVQKVKPDLFFNLGAQSHVKVSFDIPEYTMDVDGTGTLRCLEAIRHYSPETRFLQAATSVSGDTPVIVRQDNEIKLLDIEDLVENESSKTYYDNLECLTVTDDYKVKWSKVAYVFKHTSSNIYELKGSNGLKMTITGDHSVIIMNEDGDLVEKKVEDLSLSDYLLTATTKNENGVNPCFDLTEFGNMPGRPSNTQINKLQINPEIMRLIGYYLSEGSIYLAKRHSGITFTFHIKEKNYTDDIINIFSNEFNINNYSEQLLPGANTRKLKISSKQFCNFLLTHFGKLAHFKRLPGWVFTLPQDSFLELLRGYIGDARILKNEIVYTSCNKHMIEQFAYASKLHGMDCCIVKRFNKDHLSPQGTIIKGGFCYDLHFRGRNRDIIMGEFTDRSKNLAISQDLIQKNVILKLCGRTYYNKLCASANKKRVSKQRVLKTAVNINEKLKSICNSDIHVVKIQSIKKINKTIPVYDLHVPETQRFIGGNYPILLHNSEMFGGFTTPQNELTPFHPRSPYGVAKLAAYWSVVNYNEAYNIFGCNTISFNHECIGEKTPIIIRNKGVVDVCSPRSLAPLRKKGTIVQTFEIDNVDIWDGKQWTPLKTITATLRKDLNPDHKMLFIESRSGIVNCTSHHTMIKDDETEIRADALTVNDKILLGDLPTDIPSFTCLTEELAEFLGLLVSEGSISISEGAAKITNQDQKLLDRGKELWLKLFIGSTSSEEYPSGFENGKPVTQMNLTGCPSIFKWISEQIYDKRTRLKKVPAIILNSTQEIQKSFIKGYYAGDGLKAGSGDAISMTTNSPILAQGLCLLYNLHGNKCSVYVEHRELKQYYTLNILKNCNLGRHLLKAPEEIRKINEDRVPDEWVFDLETGSGVFCAGVGRAVVHNSPVRGETFVTRKITRAAARIKMGLQDKLVLGNLTATRDWSHAKDIADGMLLAITAEKPDNWVISSNESHSIQEFMERVFNKLDLNWQDYVTTDPKYLRPSEVQDLCGDSTKIRTQLGWKPKYSFDDLVDEMVEGDLRLAHNEKLLLDLNKPKVKI